MSWQSAQMLQAGLAFALALVLCRGVIALKINDAPDGTRKLQAAPVPSAGGIGIAAAAMIGWVAALNGLGVSELGHETLALVTSALIALLIGLMDDMGFIGTRLKFAALTLLALAAASQLYVYAPYWFEELPYVPGGRSAPDALGSMPLLLIAGSALWLFVMMNAVNFMDGSNGLASGAAAIMILGVIVLLVGSEGGAGLAALPYIAVNAAICGFLIWNLRGQLYAGDAGALFLGALFAGGSLIVVRSGYVSVFSVATLALPFLVDVFMTLIWRARRGRNLLTAHREHAYQLFIRAGWTHWQVALLWWAGTFACVVVAVFASMMREFYPALAFFAGLILGIAAWRWQRKRYEGQLEL